MKEYNGEKITIMCCSTCNTKCSHCYLGYTGDIESDDLYNMIQQLSEKYKVDLNGSELLLNTGYLISLQYLSQNRVLINGIVIHNNIELLNEIKKYDIEWVCMSHHFGIQKEVSNVNINLVKENIKLLKSLNFKVELMATVGKDNLNSIEEMVEEAISLNVDCIRFTNFLSLGNAVNLDNTKFLLNDDDITVFFDQFYKAKAELGSSVLIRRSGTFSRDKRKDESSYYCPAGENIVAITPDMNVYPCPFLVSKGYEIGKYINGKVMINQEFNYDQGSCFTTDVVNKCKKLECRKYE